MKEKTVQELIEYADGTIENINDMYKQDMIYAILKKFSEKNPENTIIGEGVLEVLPDSFGFLRSPNSNYVAGPDDIYISPIQIKKLGLRTGDVIRGHIRAPKKGEKYFALMKLDLSLPIYYFLVNRILIKSLLQLEQEHQSIHRRGILDIICGYLVCNILVVVFFLLFLKEVSLT